MFARNAEYKYSPCHSILVKLNNGENLDDGVTYIAGDKGIRERDAHLHVDIEEAGVYGFFAEMDWTEQECYQDNNYAITRYGNSTAEFTDVTAQYTKEDILAAAFKSAAKNGKGGEIKVSNKEGEGAPGVTAYVGNDNSNYYFMYVENDEADASYTYTCEYSDAKGITLLGPFAGGLKFELNVAAGSNDIFIMKKDIMSMGYASSYSEKVNLGASSLIAKCIAEGDKQERAPGITYHSLQHSGGIIIVYTNESDG